MGILVFMVEEPSMQLFLDHYIPRRFPLPEFKKSDGARRFGLAMPLDIECNHSKSFRVFMKTVELFAEQQNTE